MAGHLSRGSSNREIVDEDALALLEAGRADVDDELRVVIGEETFDVAADFVVEPQVDVAATQRAQPPP